MRTVRTTLALACAALAAASVAHAREPERPPVTWLKGEGNFTKSHRAPKAIDRVVIHVTEGTFWGSITWLRNERSHASSHYVVSRRGRIVQLVHQSDIAWHAGNWKINARSVGIEHEGITGDPGGFTRAQYRSSARLTAYIARRSLMPIDRRHIIGHDDVPDPVDPGRYGGADNHTDPGSYWRWTTYLKLVRLYAFGANGRAKQKPRPKPKPEPRPKPIRLGVRSPALRAGQTIAGVVAWRAATRGPVRRVDFLVDGTLLRRDARAPFALAGGLRTRDIRNGRHVLELRAYGRRGAWTRSRVTVVVRNAPFAVTIRGPAGEASGVVGVGAAATGARTTRIELLVDGRPVGVEKHAPFAFRWDTRRVADGAHVLEARAVAADGRRASTRMRVVVANVVRVVSHSLADGQRVSGLAVWEVRPAGPIERVRFWVDGVFQGGARRAPYRLTWNTAPVATGPHVLLARVIGRNGKRAEVTVTVEVAPPE